MSTNVKKIAVMGMLLAAQVVAGMFVSIKLQLVTIGFIFLPLSLTGILCGPLWAAAAGVMGDRLFLRAHFVESDRASPAGDLPGRFRSCQTGADHCDCVCLSHHFHHRSLLYNYNSYWNIPC